MITKLVIGHAVVNGQRDQSIYQEESKYVYSK